MVLTVVFITWMVYQLWAKDVELEVEWSREIKIGAKWAKEGVHDGSQVDEEDN